MTTIDFNQLMKDAGDGFTPIPDGPYNVEVSKTEATTSSTDKPMIRVNLKVIDGPHAGRILFDQFVITAGNPNALGFFFEHMAAFGLDRTYFASNPPMENVAASLMGRHALVSVGTKQFKGTDRNEVTAYRPPAMGASGAPTPAGAVGGVPAPAPAPAPVAPAPAAPPPAAPAAPAPVPQAAPPQPAPVPAPAAPAAVPPLPAGVAPPQPQPAAPPEQAAPPPVAPAPEPAPQQPATVPATQTEVVTPPPVPPSAAAAYNPADEEPY